MHIKRVYTYTEYIGRTQFLHAHKARRKQSGDIPEGRSSILGKKCFREPRVSRVANLKVLEQRAL